MLLVSWYNHDIGYHLNRPEHDIGGHLGFYIA